MTADNGYSGLDFVNINCFSRPVKSQFDLASLGSSLKQEGFKMDKVELTTKMSESVDAHISPLDEIRKATVESN